MKNFSSINDITNEGKKTKPEKGRKSYRHDPVASHLRF